MAKEIIKTNLKLSDKVSLKYNDREVEMTLSDFKTFLDVNLEPANAVLTSDEPLRYKCLLSQNAPIATTTDPTMVAGQIWTLEAYNAADAATIAALELVSGTLYAVGSKYRSATDQTLSVDAGTTLSYDGSPYIVSTDSNGDFAPFVNTTVEIPIFSFVSDGRVRVASPNNLYNKNKTFIMIGQRGNDSIKIDVDDIVGSSIDILTTDTTIKVNNILNYTPIEIEVYP